MTVGLALLASNVLALAKADGVYPAVWWAERVLELTCVLAAAVGLRRRAAVRIDCPAISPVLVALVAASIAWEPCQRRLLGQGRPFEILVMDGLQLMVLGLAAASCWGSCQRVAVGASLFLVMYGAMLSFTPLVHVLVGVYAAGALGWLAATYWDSLRARIIASQQRQQPRWGIVLLVGVCGAGVIAAGVGRRTAIVALRGFLPSSGGHRWNDPHARGGVGDGDLLVAGAEHIQSFAPIEEAPFVDDHLPGLYDVVSEVNGEPRKIPPRSGLRAPVPPEFAAKLAQHLHTRSETAAREFSTLRRTVPPRQRTIRDIRSDALLYVAGRTPLHLRMQTYALFDGVDWLPEPAPDARHKPEFRIVNVAGKPWLLLDDPGRWAEYLGAAETHAVKLVRLGSPVIPAPAHTHGVHIDLVNRPEFFAWGAGDTIRLRRDEIPSGVAIHLASRAEDVDRLAAPSPVGRFLPWRDEYGWLPESLPLERFRALALQWSAGAPAGWPQIQAVIERLRTDYLLDPAIELGNDERTAIEEFLFETRRGPNYQFATAAALLLRTLGYSTRLVSGFYVDPAKYDPHLRHTPVLKEDLHFWVEVHLTAGSWLTVEAAPGYEVLGPPPGVWQRMAAFRASWSYLMERKVGASAGLFAVGLLWWRRRFVLDALAAAWWRLRWSAAGRRGVVTAWRLVERRLAWTGCVRPAACTLRDWVRRLEAAGRPCAGDLGDFIPLVEWAAFAPPDVRPPQDDPEGECVRLVKRCSLQRLQAEVNRTQRAAHLARRSSTRFQESPTIEPGAV